MSFNITVDLISDLNLSEDKELNWEGKASSLICAIAGNISSDISVLSKTLDHLSNYYRGIFFIDGPKDHNTIFEYDYQIEMIKSVCESYKNVVYLHDNIIVLNGIAFIGINGWYHNGYYCQEIEEFVLMNTYRVQDITYLGTTIKNLQLDDSIKKIVVVSSSIPNINFLYNLEEEKKEPEPSLALVTDVNYKVKTWLFGGSDLLTDQTYDNRRFCNNPVVSKDNYWPKVVII